MIAGYLVQECAISTLQELWRTREIRQSFNHTPGDAYHTIIDMSLDVWVRYIHIDGIRYIAELSNQDDRSGHMSLLSTVRMFRRESRVKTIYILENHLGIRQVIFTTSTRSTKLPTLDNAELGVWWRTLSASTQFTEMEATFDVSWSTGLLLRRFADDYEGLETSRPYYWSRSQPKKRKVVCSSLSLSAGEHVLHKVLA